MWNELPESQKNEYKRLILAYASLTDMFAQKATDDDKASAPIINSKYQETAFQRAFNAYAEDIGNTSYDASVQCNGEKYLVGIKTFGINSGDQKIAQFKAMSNEWAGIIDEMKKNATGLEDQSAINQANHDLYEKLAREIALSRNSRIESSYANTRGFHINDEDVHVHSIYHVLMPSKKDDAPKIFVGETSYNKIDIDHLKVLGCTAKSNPTNFKFKDGKHTYKYTSADSQLLMDFENKNIVCDEWDVKYAADAYSIFSKIADIILPELSTEKPLQLVAENEFTYNSQESVSAKTPIESYCWTIWNANKEVEQYSGFNSFYGTGSKLGRNQRKKRVKKISTEFEDSIDAKTLHETEKGLLQYLLNPASSMDEKAHKTKLRAHLMRLAQKTNNVRFETEVLKLLFRPVNELYIPIPDSANFHKEHPDFFGKGFGEYRPGSTHLKSPKGDRSFNLVFEPSGDSIKSYITQDNGKAIESVNKQTDLGKWILRGVFQLKEYEPLTSETLRSLNINGLRFSKYADSDDIHIEFIWIDEEHPPKGFISRK